VATIQGSVGRGGRNRSDDVRLIQALLDAAGFDPKGIDGGCGANTVSAIVAFQRTFTSKPDGRVDPGGRTLERLQAAAAPPAPPAVAAVAIADSATTLFLGCIDEDAVLSSHRAFLLRHHDWSSTRLGFRDEARWRGWTSVPSGEVRAVQAELVRSGFLPHGPVDGVYGYRTRAAIRLFQEYVRAGEGVGDIGTPDGIVGKGTRRHLQRWASDEHIATWAQPDFRPTETAKRARRLLESALEELRGRHRDKLVDGVDTWQGTTATLPSDEWNADPDRVHLIGIRRNASVRATTRSNDDLFVLLGGGLTFVFRGSTDPNPTSSRDDEPYLVRGQHRYRFGWHKLSPWASDRDGSLPSAKAYRAFKPDDGGVLVIRDRDRDDALSAADVAGGLEANGSINIHWSGRGTSNWSAGCQVVGGRKYLGFGDLVADCSPFASSTYGGLARGQTRGAWHLLEDAITVATPTVGTDGDRVLYTLLYEEDLHRLDGLTVEQFQKLVEVLA
jgi:peptidoglycan hydrolase-like protein with peptidoglycan-binding domain